MTYAPGAARRLCPAFGQFISEPTVSCPSAKHFQRISVLSGPSMMDGAANFWRHPIG
jgi:hypothetical protein